MRSLDGKRIWVTAERRADVQQAFIERRGGVAEMVPLLRTIEEKDVPSLVGTVASLGAQPPDLLIAQTGQGMQWWVDRLDPSARKQFFAALAASEVWSRGKKSTSRCRSLGLDVHWEAPSETAAEIVDRCRETELRDKRVALQLVGTRTDPIRDTLIEQGAEVVDLRVYRYDLPRDRESVHRLVQLVVGGEIDAITFTASPALANLWEIVRALNYVSPFGEALRTTCAAVVVGPVCAATARSLGWQHIVEPERARLMPMLLAAEEALAGPDRL